MSVETTNYGFVKPELTDVADITATNRNWDILDINLKSILDCVTTEYYQSSLLASNWVGSKAPYTYTIYGYENKVVEVLEDVNMTMEQLEAIENAKIKGDPISDKHILYAFGEKPTIDVPVVLGVHGRIG